MTSAKFMGIIILTVLFSTSAFASLNVHPNQLVIPVPAGQKSSMIFHITNQGPSGNLGYKISASESWISFNSVSGNLNINDTAFIVLKIDATILSSGTYKSNIIVTDPHHGPVTVPIEIQVKSIADVNDASGIIGLTLQANPNPFISNTEIKYYLPVSENVIINVFDMKGLLVKSLINELQIEGKHLLIFDGSELASGVYFLILKTPTISIEKQIFINK
ncbi:MAG: Por secretion system C-terminal sorting protein [Ignavibacteria bacterium]|nr:Por secretion system C-terminal sorting protein [Ignavibacteria bacterium]